MEKKYKKWNLKHLKNVDIHTKFWGLLDFIDNCMDIDKHKDEALEFADELMCIKDLNKKGLNDYEIIDQAVNIYLKKHGKELFTQCL